MKRLPGVRETNMPLNAVSLDLRSPAGKTSEGYFRLIINAISDREGRLKRLGGWKPLSLGINPVGNEDLHDQLLTNAVNKRVRVDLPTFQVMPWGFDGGAPGATSMTTATIPVTGPDAIAYNAVFTDAQLPTISVVPPTLRVYVPYVTYKWRTTVKVGNAAIEPYNPGSVTLSCYSAKAGGTITVQFKTEDYTLLPAGSTPYVYGCAPDDATQWADTGISDRVSLWDIYTQTPMFITPTNTMVVCPT